MTYRLAELALIQQSVLGYGKSYLKERGWQLNGSELHRFFQSQCRTEYAYESALFPRPADWPEHAVVTRFRERQKPIQGRWPEGLDAFLDAHACVVYVGFGSMVNARPKQVALDVLSVCEEEGVAVVMNRSWGGLEPPKELPSHAFVVDDVPFELLFPQVQAAIHHGGAGTTHSALRCGLPQAIVPHIADQYFWSRQVVKTRNGVEGFPIKKWSRDRFSRMMTTLLLMEK